MLTFETIQKTIADYFRDKPVKAVWLFGSYARGEATEESDVDLLFDMDESVRISYFTLAQYLIDMEDTLAKKVDIALEKNLFEPVRPYVIADRKLLYNAA